MTFSSSPSLDQYRRGIPPKEAPGRNGLRVVIVALILLTLVLGVSRLSQTNRLALLAGSGAVEGIVVDATGQPVSAEVIIEGVGLQSRTDANGHFQISGVPAGNCLLVVGKDHAGREFPVVVTAGATTNLNQVQWLPTSEPSQ